MPMVFAEQSVSLDGFSAGANVGPDNPMGDRGEELHEWMFGPEPTDVLRDYWSGVGAVILGNRMFELGFRPWGNDNPWGKPAFVLTHDPRSELATPSGQSFTFVTDGIEQALALAGEAAGDKAIAIAGGANTVQQYIRAGLLDELHLHLVPIVLGAGTRFLDGIDGASLRLEAEYQGATTGTTHLRYRITR